MLYFSLTDTIADKDSHTDQEYGCYKVDYSWQKIIPAAFIITFQTRLQLGQFFRSRLKKLLGMVNIRRPLYSRKQLSRFCGPLFIFILLLFFLKS